jgi:hypothetical protein
MSLLEVIIVTVLLLWLAGVILPVAAVGNLIHVLLIVVIVLVILRLLQGRSV